MNTNNPNNRNGTENIFNINMNYFDYEYYRKNNKDLEILTAKMNKFLQEKFLYNHYMNHGRYENRAVRFLNDDLNKKNTQCDHHKHRHKHHQVHQTSDDKDDSDLIIKLRKDFRNSIKEN